MSAQELKHKQQHLTPHVTARSVEGIKGEQINSRIILENLSNNVVHYQRNLADFYAYVETSMQKNG